MHQLGEGETRGDAESQGRDRLAPGEACYVIEHVGNVGSGDILGQIIEIIRRLITVMAQLRKFFEAGAEFARGGGEFNDPVGAGPFTAFGQCRSQRKCVVKKAIGGRLRMATALP